MLRGSEQRIGKVVLLSGSVSGTRWTPAMYLLKNASVLAMLATLSGAVKDSESPLFEWNMLPSWTTPAVFLWPAMTRIC